jgi:hypothetical protein
MDKSTLEKIVFAAVTLARQTCSNAHNGYNTDESGPIAAALVRAALDDGRVRTALLS